MDPDLSISQTDIDAFSYFARRSSKVPTWLWLAWSATDLAAGCILPGRLCP